MVIMLKDVRGQKKQKKMAMHTTYDNKTRHMTRAMMLMMMVMLRLKTHTKNTNKKKKKQTSQKQTHDNNTLKQKKRTHTKKHKAWKLWLKKHHNNNKHSMRIDKKKKKQTAEEKQTNNKHKTSQKTDTNAQTQKKKTQKMQQQISKRDNQARPMSTMIIRRHRRTIRGLPHSKMSRRPKAMQHTYLKKTGHAYGEQQKEKISNATKQHT